MSGHSLEALRRALGKRGFKVEDPQRHDCAACGERAIEKWTLQSKLGGRDIDLCLACAAARSWSRRGNLADREEETPFDLAVFLRL
jgi:hypothetical protein